MGDWICNQRQRQASHDDLMHTGAHLCDGAGCEAALRCNQHGVARPHVSCALRQLHAPIAQRWQEVAARQLQRRFGAL